MDAESDYRRQIAARSRPFHRRLETPTEYDPSAADADWIAEWRDRVAEDDQDVFQRRLEIEGLSVEECQRRLADPEWPADEPLPDWLDRFASLLEYALDRGPDGASRDPIGEDEVPFAHLLTVVVEYASEQVEWTLPTARLSDSALAGFERWLVDRLSQLCAHSLFLEFKTYVGERDRELALADDPEMPAEPRRYYDSFVETMLDGELSSFFFEYAVLARLVATVVDNWIETMAEFGARLDADWEALEATFGPAANFESVTDVEVLGDPHHGGRRVFALTFDSETKCLYKPRDVRIDVAYSSFLEWVNENADLPSLRTLTCIARDGYGWVEWVEQDSCDSPDGVARYYYRAGMLLCLLYALNFTDGHLENLIAAGDQPMFVDLETLMEPFLADEKKPANRPIREPFSKAVLRTYVLPMHFPESEARDLGGLGHVEGEATGTAIQQFSDVNTDIMDLGYGDTSSIEGNSLPILDGEPIEPGGYSDEIGAGFEAMYRFVLDRREQLLADDGPLAAFEDATVRSLYRATMVYTRTLVPFKTPSFQRTGQKFGCKVEMLADSFARGDTDLDMWPIFEAEREALWRFDVPRFTAETTGTDLFWGDRRIADVFETSPLDQVKARIEGFDETDLAQQLDYIELAYAPESLSHPTPPRFSRTDETPDIDELSRRKPRDLFERVQSHAYRADGDLTWTVRQNRDDSGIYFTQLQTDLYEGRAGMSVFGAALATVFDEPRYREFVDDVAGPLVTLMDDFDGEEESPFGDERIGAGHGTASIVYGFTKLGQLLDDDRYFEAAHRAATYLTTERIEADTAFDVVGGSAGAILGLLALSDAVGDSAYVDRAILAGDHLLETRIEEDGVGVWRTTNDSHALNGFLHGTAGIAYALTRLADVTGADRFRAVALDCLEHERAQYSPEQHNWPDRRLGTDTDFVPGWCAGRAGIGLGRLGMYEIDPRPDLRAEVEAALAGIDPETLLGRDHVCCGNFSNVELLARAGRTLDERYLEQARTLADLVVQRADSAGHYTVPWQTDNWFNPSFFRGEPGIGYSLLRLANPDLPCVLLWE